MHRWTDLDQVPPGFGPSVVTIGNFDGVHLGHRQVLTRMVADARAAGIRAVAVTFDPHPLQLHRPDEAPPLITGVRDKLELLASTGLDAVLVQPYTWDFARQSPERFVRRFLVDGLHARTVVVGHDVRFGWQNAGDLSTMLALGSEHGFSVEVIDDVKTPDGGRRWSSTWVRELLSLGDVSGAAEILGRPHRLRGVVVEGDKRGRELGFPTANLASDADGLVPADGVYAGWLSVVVPEAGERSRLPAAISIGTNPTFAGVSRRVEAYVIGRTDLDLYGDEILLEFAERLRPTLKFDSIDDLIATMTDDVAKARVVLGI
ncbi:bifunctional riboflavin kinase/FAD synthetase [Jiangella alkaliphila]|uniref:Riboflavin biosynthesis protein n=1 Tax=Jiangella alkaliphila TaxID=419479 RepID=A0A1H2L788_9ACTN|nr:bifunctional riboflavin kinase/FAD synthetase [Jiangella alkaliphila]SDU76306.1 riboflavin kinase / FMN adenylyltransferase [Jiangella alkaliphila]